MIFALRYFFLVIVLILVNGCNSEADMSEFQRKWQDLTSSTSISSESRRVEELAAYARSHSIVYQLSLTDTATGKSIPIGNLDKLKEVPEVHLKLQADESTDLIWKPLGKDNIYPLFLE
jgi:hypothetical protein